MRRDFLLRHAGLLRQDFNDLRTQHRTQLVRRNRLVLSRPDPRLHDVAQATLLKLVEQPAQSAEQITTWVAGWRSQIGRASCRERVEIAGGDDVYKRRTS